MIHQIHIAKYDYIFSEIKCNYRENNFFRCPKFEKKTKILLKISKPWRIKFRTIFLVQEV